MEYYSITVLKYVGQESLTTWGGVVRILQSWKANLVGIAVEIADLKLNFHVVPSSARTMTAFRSQPGCISIVNSTFS